MIKHITSPTARHNSRTGGAVIIVVLALMTTLLVLGLFFYYFTVDEALNAQNVADAEDINIDDDEIFNVAQRQFIVSTPDEYSRSAIYGSNWSLLGHILGPMNGNGSARQLTPYSGPGLTMQVISGTDSATYPDGRNDAQTDSDWIVSYNISEDLDGDGNLDPSEDANGNGILDPGEDLNLNGLLDASEDLNGNGTLEVFEDINGNGALDGGEDVNGNGLLDYGVRANGQGFRLNMSAAANGGAVRSHKFYTNAGYTYPDLNAPFLAVDYVDLTNPTNPVRILRPSFFPIQLCPDYRGSGDLDQIAFFQSFRPHPSHLAVPGQLRFLRSAVVAQSGDRSRIINPFPGMWTPGNPQLMSAGAWTNTANYDYDIDVTGDGQADAIRLDLDHPHFDLPDGRQVVPIFAVKIMEQDGLFNLSAHGNENRRLMQFDTFGNPSLPQVSLDAQSLRNDTSAGDPPTDQSPMSISGSNMGKSVTEINPTWGFFASPHNSNFTNGGSISSLLTDYWRMNPLAPPSGSPGGPLQPVPIDDYFSRPNAEVLNRRKHL
ncbi:MAG: hypothetical protein KDA69_18090, partial [Planctomycetaceae bacterium]|nr:hypothetical protein [Planctomycetaceae bacterium]